MNTELNFDDEEDTTINGETKTFQHIIQSINLNLQYLTLSLPNENILPEDNAHIYKLCKEYIQIYEKIYQKPTSAKPTSAKVTIVSSPRNRKNTKSPRPAEILNWRAR
jgi:hypothetical protein